MRSISERSDNENGVNSVKLFLVEGQKDNTEPSFSSDGIEGVTVRCRDFNRVSNASKSALLLNNKRRRDDLSLRVIARGKDKKPSPSFSEDVTSNWQMICVPFMALTLFTFGVMRRKSHLINSVNCWNTLTINKARAISSQAKQRCLEGSTTRKSMLNNSVEIPKSAGLQSNKLDDDIVWTHRKLCEERIKSLSPSRKRRVTKSEAEIVAGVAAEIALEIDREIIDDLRTAASLHSSFDISAVPSGSAYGPLYWYRNLITNMTRCSNAIHKATLRGPANFAITSPEVSAYIEQLETHGDFRPIYAAGSSDAKAPAEQPHQFGVYKLGTIASKYVVYKDTFFPTVNAGSGSGYGDILMGYKGQNWIDAGFVWAPYVPLQLTATLDQRRVEHEVTYAA